MKRALKKILPLTLIICVFVVYQCGAALALSLPGNSVKGQNDDWYGDEELLYHLGLSGLEKITDDGDASRYLSETGTIITVKENSPQRVSLEYRKGDLLNTLVFSKEEGIFLNGNDVTPVDENGKRLPVSLFETDKAPTVYTLNNIGETVSPCSGFSTYFKKTCPYGKKENYNVAYGTEKCADLKLRDELTDLFIEVFINLLCNQFQVMGDVASDFFTDVYYELKKTDPQTTAMSYTMGLKTHESYKSGYIPSLWSFVWKCDIKLYSKANYKGTISRPKGETYKVKLTV